MSSTTLHGGGGGTGAQAGDVNERRILAVLALLSLAAGFVHASVLDAHRGHGVAAWAFGIAAVFQVAWAALVYLRPTRVVLVVGAVVNAAFVGGWVLSRTTGIAFLDGFEESESVGFSDAVATGAEVLLVAGALLLVLAPAGLRLVAGGLGGTGLGIVGVATAMLAVPAVSQGGSFHDHGQSHEHVAAGEHGAGHEHGGDAHAAHDDAHATAAGETHADDHEGTADHAAGAHDDGHDAAHVESAAAHPDGHAAEHASGAAHPVGGSSDHHTDPADAHPAGHDTAPDHGHPSTRDPGANHPAGHTGSPAHPHPPAPGPGPSTEHPHPPSPGPNPTPSPAHPHPPGPGPTPPGGVTPAQQAAADALLADTKAILPEWSDEAKVEDAGFRTIGDGGTGTEHLINWNWIDDDVVLDPRRPESLVYHVDEDGRELVAAMFMLPFGTVDADVPDVGGTLTQWHVHDDLCLTPERLVDGHPQRTVAAVTTVDGSCSRGEKLGRTPMLHVWIIEHPCGPFSSLEGVGAGQAIVEPQDPNADPDCQHSTH